MRCTSFRIPARFADAADRRRRGKYPGVYASVIQIVNDLVFHCFGKWLPEFTRQVLLL